MLMALLRVLTCCHNPYQSFRQIVIYWWSFPIILCPLNLQLRLCVMWPFLVYDYLDWSIGWRYSFQMSTPFLWLPPLTNNRSWQYSVQVCMDEAQVRINLSPGLGPSPSSAATWKPGNLVYSTGILSYSHKFSSKDKKHLDYITIL